MNEENFCNQFTFFIGHQYILCRGLYGAPAIITYASLYLPKICGGIDVFCTPIVTGG